MKYSENYKLWLPEDTDPVRVSDLSENFENIDSLIRAANNSNLSIVFGKVSSMSFTVTKTAGSASKRFTLSAEKPIKCIICRCSGYLQLSIGSNVSTYKTDAMFSAGSDISASISGSEASSSCGLSVPAPNNQTSVTVTARASLYSSFSGTSATGYMDNFEYIMITGS